jgi:lipoprotein-anchoring transpeptidase ErfK/SrfK
MNFKEDGMTYKNKLATFLKPMLAMSLVASCSLLTAGTHPAVDAVKSFYQSAEAGAPCETALQINPNYTMEQCDQLLSQHIRSIQLLNGNQQTAEVYLDLVFEDKQQGQQHFKGNIQLINDSGMWRMLDAQQQTTQQLTDNTGKHTETLAKLKQEYPDYARNGVVLVDVSEQKMYLYRGNMPVQIFPVSTATKGEGSKAGSDKTPLGAHRVSERYGDGAPLGTIFKARQNTGKVAQIITEPKDVAHDYVTTRILWLDGLELGKNKGKGIDSHSRYIYIHGTAEEGLIGQKASHGCIRMINADVVKVYDQVPVNALVYIQH